MKKEYNLSILLTSILYLILGIVFIAATEQLLKTFNYILVCLCAVIGVIQIINFFVSKKYKENNFSNLLIAVIFIWVSLILYVYYGFMINILPILFSLYLFVMSCEMIIKFINSKDIVNINRKKYLILSVISLIIGLLLIFNPGAVIYIYLKVTGIYLIIVASLYFLDFKKEIKNYKK